MPSLLLASKGYGLSIDDINASCPADMQPYLDAYRLMEERIDANNWMLGAYIQNAVAVAIERNLAGKKSKSKYLESPFSQIAKGEEKELTEEELNAQIRKAILIEDMTAARMRKSGVKETKMI